jgi:hypothetical protein
VEIREIDDCQFSACQCSPSKCRNRGSFAFLVEEVKEETNGLSESEFCEIVKGYYGEPCSSLYQLAKMSFTGVELFMFINHVLTIKRK